jgi:hypothetical protein
MGKGRSAKWWTWVLVGDDDGTKWVGATALPLDRSPRISSCFESASREHPLPSDNRADRLDAEVALLRGCAIEEALSAVNPEFHFAEVPRFDIKDGRRPDDESRRSAEIVFVVPLACRSRP